MDRRLNGATPWWQRMVVVTLALLVAACAQMPAAERVPVACPMRETTLTPPTTDALTVTYFGTSTLMFQHGAHAVMVDGFFTRPGGLARLVLGQIKPKCKTIHAVMKAGAVPRTLAAVLVTHSHHDHALDSAIVAHQTDATLVGSKSTMRIAEGQLSAEDFVALKKEWLPRAGPMDLGGFHIEAIAGPHSDGPPLIGPLLDGEIAAPLAMPAHVASFKMGGNYAFYLRHPTAEILVLPSAAVPERVPEMKDCNTKPCVVFLSIGALGKRDQAFLKTYWDQVVVRSHANVVVPVHWDDWTKPLSSPLPVAPWLFGDFEASMRNIEKLVCKKGVKIQLLEPFQAVEVKALGGCPFVVQP